MKSRSLTGIGIFVLAFSVCGFAYTGGNGTSSNPYQIASVADFQQLSNTSTDWNKSFILTANIDLSGQTYTKSPIAPDTKTSDQDVYSGTKFTGVFDGSGHTISNLTINTPTKDFIAVFGYIDSGGQVKNLGVENVNLNGRYVVGGLAGYFKGTIINCHAAGSTSGGYYIGGLVGWNDSGAVSNSYATGTASSIGDSIGGLVGRNVGTLSNCYANETVTGSSYSVGGLVGYNGNDSAHSGTIINCHAAGTVTSTSSSVGGLIGYNTYDSVISNCYATATVSGTSSVGGLAGYNDSSIAISDCYATGQVTGTGTDYSVGGLVGYNYEGTLLRCSASGAVHGIQQVGGLVGQNRYGSILNCYATGTTTGTSVYVGGLVGYNNSDDSSTPCTISNCYATGAASGTGGVGGLIGYNGYPSATSYCYSTGTATPVGTGVAGGMVGTNQYGTYTACFWDMSTNGRSNGVGYNFGGAITGMLGKSTDQMKQQATFTANPYLWDFVGEITNGTNDHWRMCVDNVDYPRLTWSCVSIGDLACPNGVNIEDLDTFIPWWLSTSCNAANNFCGTADINKSTTVNLEDFAILATNWLTGTGIQ